MPSDVSKDVRVLANRFEEVCKFLQSVAVHNPSDSEFWKTIHFPGYTTPRDIAASTALLEIMHQQAKAIAAVNEALVEGAKSSLTKAAA